MDHAVLARQAALGAGHAQRELPLNSLQARAEHHFRLLQPLGQGPCGHVFTAEDSSSKQIVVVKIINVKEPDWHVKADLAAYKQRLIGGRIQERSQDTETREA